MGRADPKMLGASGFERIDADAYFTLDASMCVEALLRAFPLPPGIKIYEPAAGRGHLVQELREHGYDVTASDLLAHPDPLIDDIGTGLNILQIDDLSHYDIVITNLPYNTQDRLLQHLLPIAARDKTMVATLTRAPWHLAASRSGLVHYNKHFHGVVHLPRRPWWSEDRTSSPRHDFVWNLWTATPRLSQHPTIHYPLRVLK
jgi:hypothetical protein